MVTVTPSPSPSGRGEPDRSSAALPFQKHPLLHQRVTELGVLVGLDLVPEHLLERLSQAAVADG